MLKNYLKIALRHLRRQAGYSFINIFGLAVGMTCCVLILLYVLNERSYDRHHENADRIYRLALDVETPSGTMQGAISALPFAAALQADYPEVLNYVRFHKVSGLFEHDGRRFQEEFVLYADASVFDVFTLPLASGDPATALTQPYSLVLTEEAARRYFGHTNVLGQTLVMNQADSYTITGVLGEVPNTHLQFDVLLSLSTWEAQFPDRSQNWTWYNFYTYLLLPEGYDPAQLEAKMPDFVARHTEGIEPEEGVTYSFPLQPLTDIYLRSERMGEIGVTGNLRGLYLFSIIAVLILLVACINFMNLSTARSVQRAREVGMRKVLGARRGQLVQQFLGESILLSLLALVLTLVLCALLLPTLTSLIGKPLVVGRFVAGPLSIMLIGVVLGVGVLAGSYPALVLSGFRPVRVLKGVYRSTAHGQALRKGLVVFQFAISIILMTGTVVVYTQLDYMLGQDLGFDEEQLVALNFRGDPHVVQHIEAIKQDLAALPGVVQVAASDFTPGSGHGTTSARIDVGQGQFRDEVFPYSVIDYDYLQTYGIETVAGRDFSRDFASDSTAAFLVNEAAVERLGWAAPEEALGKRIQQWGRDGEIVGVVRDFHYRSLHQAIEPLILHIRPEEYRVFSVRVQTDQVHATIAALEQRWQQLVPGRPFEYAFLDDQFQQQYEADARFGKLFGYFSALAILIACLGLFGLAAFSAAQRTKEVGVRKVLGASIGQILMLLSRDFTKPVLWAFALGAPVAYFALQRWLGNFAYHADLSPWLLLLVGVGVMAIAWLSVGYQSIKAALTDPVTSLRYE